MNQSPPFTAVLATVWKVAMAILLIPFLLLLGYILVQMLPGNLVTFVAIAFAIGAVLLLRSRR